jgi:catechol 2,3-dioxygenase-like lactoylglutathione lyase family enzyme
MPWLFHHVQIAIPPQSETQAREFYGKVLGCEEVPKPATLAGRGGVWFRYGGVELHLGVEEDHRPARKAHPGILVADLDELDAKLRNAGYEVEPDYLLPGYRRLYVSDPFGNRLEFLAVL